MDIPEIDITDCGRDSDDKGRQSIYSYTLYFDGDDESGREGGRISFAVMRRIEGSCELHVHGDYGPRLSEEEVWTGRALTAIDELKGYEYAFRPTREVHFEHTEAIAPVTTARQAQKAIAQFLADRQDVPCDVHACHLVFGDERLYMHDDRLGRMYKSHSIKGTTVQYSRGYTIAGSEFVQYSRPHDFVGVDDMLEAMWKLYEDVHLGAATMDDMRRHNERKYSDKFAELDRKRAEPSEEDKRLRRDENARSQLSEYQGFGINIRTLLEADPFFEGQVDALMAAIDQSGAFQRDMINGIASALAKVIKPIDEDAQEEPS